MSKNNLKEYFKIIRVVETETITKDKVGGIIKTVNKTNTKDTFIPKELYDLIKDHLKEFINDGKLKYFK